MFDRWLARGQAAAAPQATANPAVLVVSAPPQFRPDLLKRCRALSTYEAIAGLLETARRSVEIFSPYVDPTFTGLARAIHPSVRVRVVTTTRDGRSEAPNPVLERCRMERNLQVRYLMEHRRRAQMFQMHAKLVRADDRAAYVGSANLTDTSIHYNLELGVLTEHPAEVAALGALFDFVWEAIAR
jgi:phosphatidylserine/phosphatidylglycerophosphate/cardiolipin synthase-like enzyme